jgi:hypothetical protein
MRHKVTNISKSFRVMREISRGAQVERYYIEAACLVWLEMKNLASSIATLSNKS